MEEFWLDEKLVKGNNDMRQAARDYFSGLYMEDCGRRPRLDGMHFKRLSDASRQLLAADFTENEVLESLKMCNRDKTPGPDGFNIKFLREFCHVIKGDVIDLFRELHDSSEFVNSLDTTFPYSYCKEECSQRYQRF